MQVSIRMMKIRSVIMPAVIPAMSLRLKLLDDADNVLGVGSAEFGFPKGIAATFFLRPSSNLHWDTENVEFS